MAHKLRDKAQKENINSFHTMNQDLNYTAFYEVLRSVEEQAQEIWQDDEDLRSVILLGSSGVGKSAFANNMINKLVMVKTLSNIVILESEGVDYGSISITKKTTIVKK